jgi:hypothetical protein
LLNYFWTASFVKWIDIDVLFIVNFVDDVLTYPY